MSKMEMRMLREVLEESQARYLYLAKASFLTVEERATYSNKAEVCGNALEEMNASLRDEPDQPERVAKITKVGV